MTPKAGKYATVAIYAVFYVAIAAIVGFAVWYLHELNHMDDKEKWGDAFAKARFQGVPAFVFNGKTYSTETGIEIQATIGQ